MIFISCIYLNLVQFSNDRMVLKVLIVYKMEEQKKKYLLTRIKKQESIIQSDYDKYKRLYQKRNIEQERIDAYLQLALGIFDHNNAFALNLIQYLEKTQINDIFQRANLIFVDLVEKHKNIYATLKRLEEGKNSLEIRQICQICQQKIESNHIEHIRNVIDEQSNARSNLIKKLIEQSQKERNKPLFTFQQDQLFKEELQKVLKKKELSLEENVRQSNIFLQTVTNQITDFMISFRNDFANWENAQEEQNLNWANIMKAYLNKKLTKSFEDKIPKWIKKMHGTFVDSQPVKPKKYFMNQSIQTIQTNSIIEEQLKRQLNQLKSKMNDKNIRIKEYSDKLQLEMMKNVGLKNQIDNLEKMIIKKGEYNKEQGRQSKNSNFNLNDSNISGQTKTQPQQVIKLNLSKMGRLNEMVEQELMNHRQILPIVNNNKNKPKATKMIMMQTKNKANLRMSTEGIQKGNVKKQMNISKFQINQTESICRDSQVSKQSQLQQNQSILLLNNHTKSIKESNRTIEDSTLKLKKKAYNRQKKQQLKNEGKQEIISDQQNKYIQSTSSASKRQNKKLGDSTVQVLKQKVKNIAQGLRKSSQLNPSILSSPRTKNKTKQTTVFPTEIQKQNSSAIGLSHIRSQSNFIPTFADSLSLTQQQEIQTEQNQTNHSIVKLHSNQNTPRRYNKKNQIKHENNSQIQQENQGEAHELQYLISHNSKDSRTVDLKNVQQTQQKIKKHFQNIKIGNMLDNSKDLRQLSNLLEKYLYESEVIKVNKINTKSYKTPEISIGDIIKIPPINHSNSLTKKKNRDIIQKQQRHKSLHVRKQSSKKKTIKLPKILKSQYGYKDKEQLNEKYRLDLGEENILLFIDDQLAFNYEQSFNQIENEKHIIKPNATQTQGINHIFDLLQIIKIKNNSLYLQICSFFRHPFTSIKSHFLTLDSTHQINISRLFNYFLKILWIHKKCIIKKSEIFCSHIGSFISNLKEISITGHIKK